MMIKTYLFIFACGVVLTSGAIIYFTYEPVRHQNILQVNHRSVDRGKWDPNDLPPDFFPHPYTVEGKAPAKYQWTILAVGDIMAHTRVQQAANFHSSDLHDTSAGYDWVFSGVKELISRADIAVGNLEFPVLSEAPPSGTKPFNGTPEYLDGLKRAGFDVLFTANNHVLDQGIEGSEKP